MREGMSNCCAGSSIHFDRWLHEWSRSSSKALAISSECGFVWIAEDDDDDVNNNLDSECLASELV